MSRRRGLVVVLGCLTAGLAAGEAQIHLKNSRPAATEDLEDHLVLLPRRRASTRSHVLVQFSKAPRPEQLHELERRGAAVLQYVPEFGLLLSVPDNTPFDGLGLRWAGRLRQPDKLSPLLDREPAGPGQVSHFLVEFFPDVDAEDARALIHEHLVETRDHPDLRPNEFLVRASRERVWRLAEWEEVSYVYPASRELVEGVRLKACAGALTIYGPLGQYVARAGEGWDGPGQNAAELRYFFSSLASRLPRVEAQSEITRALGEWAKYAALRFVAGELAAPRTLNFLFASGSHGDPFPFDGRGKVLAHAFYPAPPNPEPIAGDVHFDDDENWTIGDYIDLFTVALHETGHALGLGHSDKPGAVMYPYYRRASALTAEDIAAIRDLYAVREEPPAPAPPPNPPPVPPAPPKPQPDPPPQPKPDPAPPRPAADTLAPSLTITFPATTNLATYAATIVLRGTASDNVGVTEVTWASSGGGSGPAQGATYWTTGEIPLNEGANTITIRARDAAGNVGWRSVVVTKRRP